MSNRRIYVVKLRNGVVETKTNQTTSAHPVDHKAQTKNFSALHAAITESNVEHINRGSLLT